LSEPKNLFIQSNGSILMVPLLIHNIKFISSTKKISKIIKINNFFA
jgi:hypothetical protein